MPGLASVVLDFMDFEGDEIYFTNVPALIGVTYGDALLGFSKSSLIGIRRANGKVELNPSHDTVFGEGDQVIAVSEDDDTVVYTRATQPTVAPARVDREPDTSVSLLVIGWSDMGEKVITALTPFLAHNSELTVVAEESFVASPPQASYHGVPVTYRTIDGSLATLESIAKEKHFDEIIVLAYRHGISSDDADGKTMLSMLLLNHLFDVHDNGIERTRLVAEILDSRRRDLARIAHADDLVVSDNLSALMMCQISENPDLTAVYDDLFDADGAQLLVLPIENYVTPGVTVSFAELVAAASLRGESAVGYRSASHDEGDPAAGVHVNPAKSQLFTPNAGDGLVVIGSV
jgi:voltage-gated potassium channel Kch